MAGVATNGLDSSTLVGPDRTSSTLYTDQAIFEAEMKRIYESTWVWVAHGSEIPNPGDFKLSHVGLNPVIIVRDRKGKVHVHVNRCRHRASTLCEVQKGRTSSFVCPYHGWSYGLDGSLRGIPHEEGNDPAFKKSDFPLLSLRVEEYKGLYFATFNQEIEPLEAFLGGAKKWIDLFLKQGGGYPIKALGEHKIRYPGNWKIQLENTTDAYHFPFVHKSFLEATDTETEEQMDVMNNGGYVEHLGNGHCVLVLIPELVDLDENLDAPIPEKFAELAAELAKDYSDEEVRRIVRGVDGTGFLLNLFPNLGCSMAFFRVLRPIAVDETEIRHIAIGMDGGPEAGNRVRRRIHEFFQGPMGFGSPDDAEAWDRVQCGAQGGRTQMPVLLTRGLSQEDTVQEGLLRSQHVSGETGMRAAYAQWAKLMETAE